MGDAEVARIRDDTMSPRDMDKLRQALVDRTQITTTRGNLPVWATHPGAQSALRFKKFLLGQTRVFVQDVMGEARRGNFRPAVAALATTVPLSDLLVSVREALFGPSGNREDLDEIVRMAGKGRTADAAKALGLRLAEDLDFTGYLGWAALVTTRPVMSLLREKRETAFEDPIVDFLTPPAARAVGEFYTGARGIVRPPRPTRFFPDPRTRALQELVESQLPAFRQGMDAYRVRYGPALDRAIVEAYRQGRRRKVRLLARRGRRVPVVESLRVR